MKKIIFVFSISALLFLSIDVSANPNGIPRVGEKAPDLNYKNIDGEFIKLSDLEGSVVLLDFWASWCGPCRRKNPQIVALYEQYKTQKFTKGTDGFKVYSVSLDRSKQRWTNAIKNDKLDWPEHVSDLKGWSSTAAAKYGVRAIPTTYLIDEDGYIIGRNLSPQAIQLELDKRLKSSKKKN